MEKPEPTEFGYKKDTDTDNQLRPIMMTPDVSAPELLNDFLCKCSPSECTIEVGCVCLKNAQPCTAACACKPVLPGMDEEGCPCANQFTMEALRVIGDMNSDSE